MNDGEKAQVFLAHIRRHLEDDPDLQDQEIVCKFCGKTVDEIYHEFLRLMGEGK